MATILITGATDGIGLASARELGGRGHRLVLHGRSAGKLDAARDEVQQAGADAVAGTALADLADLAQVDRLAAEAVELGVDVVVNNAGVYATGSTTTDAGLDVRFVVNTIAPYRLTRLLLPSLPSGGRVVNVASAAQAPVDLDALAGRTHLDDHAAYAQSKLALVMWTRHLAGGAGGAGADGPVVVAVNPGSLLATKMVREGFGIDGKDVGIGVDVLTRAATADEFDDAGGRYFDGDAGRFGEPHGDAADEAANERLVAALDEVVGRLAGEPPA